MNERQKEFETDLERLIEDHVEIVKLGKKEISELSFFIKLGIFNRKEVKYINHQLKNKLLDKYKYISSPI